MRTEVVNNTRAPVCLFPSREDSGQNVSALDEKVKANRANVRRYQPLRIVANQLVVLKRLLRNLAIGLLRARNGGPKERQTLATIVPHENTGHRHENHKCVQSGMRGMGSHDLPRGTRNRIGNLGCESDENSGDHQTGSKQTKRLVVVHGVHFLLALLVLCKVH